jgi:GNAT superfamily N-acetyltransferase
VIDVADVAYRESESSDWRAIATLHAESWRRSYRGMLPDAYLDNDVFADRAELWERRFGDTDYQRATVTVLAEAGARLVGFAHSRVDEEPEWGTLLDNLHVTHDAQRLGVATRLVAETASLVAPRALSPALYLWVLEANSRARAFYESMGGQPVERGVSREGGGEAPCLRYWWPDVSKLSGPGV